MEKQQEACNGEKNYWMLYFRISFSTQNYDFQFHTSNKVLVCKFHQFMVFHFASMSLFIGEGNGNPRQYSCLENPMDRGAWYIPLDLKEVDINEATQHSPMHIDSWRLLTILFTTYRILFVNMFFFIDLLSKAVSLSVQCFSFTCR